MLLVTKHFIPPARWTHVERTPLLSRLDGVFEHKLLLIAASAGSGKTMLAADWSNRHKDVTCWLSLDSGDNHVIRFLAYIVGAIQTRVPDFGTALFSALLSPQPPTPENALYSLVNQIASISETLVLVLDDYHVIENPDVHQALAFLLEYLPANFHLVMLTRIDPPLPLPRMRARNELLEIRAEGLRFVTYEIAELLNGKMRFNLSLVEVLALERRTEGWIAGLQLAGLAMQTVKDKHAFIDSFTGSHRFVLDYLIEEVLNRQPKAVRRFLLQTSFLVRLNPDLCNAVTGKRDGMEMLDLLERRNLFLIPLDSSRQWFRYHHLFSDLLQTRFVAEISPKTLKMLYGRAAEWHEANSDPVTAIDYALEAEDYPYAARIMAGGGPYLMQGGEVTQMLGWYERFPQTFLNEQPRLYLLFGLAFALNGRWQEAKRLLTIVDNHALPDAEALLLTYLVGDRARLFINEVPQDRVAKLVYGLLLSTQGNLEQATRLLVEAQGISERDHDDLLRMTALFHLCRLRVFMGSLREAYELCQTALQQNHTLAIATFAHVSLGRILFEWNELDRAEAHLKEAIQLGEASGFLTGNLSSATMMLAEIQQARGDSEGAVQKAAEAMGYAEKYDPPHERIWLKTYGARLFLNGGNVAQAVEWMQTDKPLQPSLFYPPQIQAVTRARVLLMERKTEEALALLTEFLTEGENLLTVEAFILLAITRQAQGDSVHTMLAMEQALARGERENRVRVFLDLRPIKLLTRFPEHPFAQKLLRLMPSESPSQVEPLSERELQILRLIVAGHSNEEIAQTLTLALSTVKWYINMLYGKLHVKSRSQAIARAHGLKLFQ